ncbi:MAG: FAD-dependent oxidoreductase [Allosphingosinicella sp.]
MVTPRAEKVDAVVVGAGAAGSLWAARLAQAGKSVVVLEAGPPWTMADLTSSQIWARRLKWGGAPVEQGAERSFAHNLNTGSGFGGAALHHFGTWPRMPLEAFRLKSLHGRGLDWPFEYEVLRPWYDRVQSEVGIAGDAAAEPWRPPGAPYPMPGLRRFAQGEILARGFERLGIPVSPLPAAITTTWFKGRPPCQYDGWCDAGCPIHSLANPLATHLRQAQDAGAVLHAYATVLHLLPGRAERAAGIVYADRRGLRVRQEADMIVLAASVVQNPRILLSSRGPRWPNGAGNGSGQVGRHLMLDASGPVYGLFDEPTENHLGVSAGQLMHRALYRERSAAPLGSYQWQIAPSMKPNDIFGTAVSRAEIFGAPLHDFIRRASRHLASMVVMAEQFADPANRIELGSGTDRFGMKLPRVVHRFDQDTQRLWQHCMDEGQSLMRAAGAREAWTGRRGGGHPAGGTIMGTDPAHSVTDGFGRLHEIPNVFVAGSGLHPATGGASPTFTLLAVAERAADHAVRNWAGIAA